MKLRQLNWSWIVIVWAVLMLLRFVFHLSWLGLVVVMLLAVAENVLGFKEGMERATQIMDLELTEMSVRVMNAAEKAKELQEAMKQR